MIIFNTFVMDNSQSGFSAADVYVYFQKNYANILNSKEIIIPETYADPQPHNLLGRAIVEYLEILVDYSFLRKSSDKSFYDQFNILKRTL